MSCTICCLYADHCHNIQQSLPFWQHCISPSPSLSLSHPFLSTFNLILWPSSDVFAPGVEFNVHDSDGAVRSSAYDPGTFYKGIIRGICTLMYNVNGSLIFMMSMMMSLSTVYPVFVLSV